MKFKFSLIIGLFLSACSTTPWLGLPLSELETPEAIVNGSAIAFQIDQDNCASGAVYFAPVLADGKYGKSTRIRWNRSLLGGIVNDSAISRPEFQSNDPERLNVLTLPPGKYTALSLSCRTGSYVVSRPKNAIPHYFDFEVEAGKTRYIGQLTPMAISYRLAMWRWDKSDIAREQFDARYRGRVGDFEVKLAMPNLGVYRGEKTNPSVANTTDRSTGEISKTTPSAEAIDSSTLNSSEKNESSLLSSANKETTQQGIGELELATLRQRHNEIFRKLNMIRNIV